MSGFCFPCAGLMFNQVWICNWGSSWTLLSLYVAMYMYTIFQISRTIWELIQALYGCFIAQTSQLNFWYGVLQSQATKVYVPPDCLPLILLLFLTMLWAWGLIYFHWKNVFLVSRSGKSLLTFYSTCYFFLYIYVYNKFV